MRYGVSYLLLLLLLLLLLKKSVLLEFEAIAPRIGTT